MLVVSDSPCSVEVRRRKSGESAVNEVELAVAPEVGCLREAKGKSSYVFVANY